MPHACHLLLPHLPATLAGTGFSVEEYDTSVAVFAVFERSVAIAALRAQFIAGIPEENRTQAVVESRVAALYQQLRSSAAIEILIPDP